MRRVPSARAVTRPASLSTLQVLRDGRSADRQVVGDLPDRLRPCSDALEDLATGRVGEGGESVGQSQLVSHDLP